MRAPAWWRRLRAWLGGYFWLPCPCCGEPFAGYEWKAADSSVPNGRPAGSRLSTGICPPCTRKGYGRGHRWLYVESLPIAQRPDLPRRWVA